MRTAIWAIGALLLYWGVATIQCGGFACLPYILFFYLPFWLPIVVVTASSEWISRRFTARWSPACFIGLIAVGGSYLIYVLKGRFPQLFIDAERSIVPMGLIIKPTGAVVALYSTKIVRDWWSFAEQNDARRG